MLKQKPIKLSDYTKPNLDSITASKNKNNFQQQIIKSLDQRMPNTTPMIINNTKIIDRKAKMCKFRDSG